MRKIIFLFSIFVLMLSGAARAEAPDAAINAAGAAVLKKQIGDELQWRNDMTKVFGQGLSAEGETEVTPKSNFYEVTLPHLSMLAGPKGKLDIGTIIIHATPDKKPGVWLMQVTLPAAMTFYDAKDAPVANISTGSQKIEATWWPDKGMYPKINFLVQNVQVKGVGGDAITASIGTLKSFVDMKDNGDDTWSGPVDFEVSGITVDVPGKNPAVLDVGKISAHNTYDRLNISQSLAIKEAARKALKAGMPQTNQEKQAFLAKLMVESPVTADSIGGTFELDKLLLHDKEPKPQQPPHEVALGQLVFSAMLTNGQEEKNKLALKASYDGLRISSFAATLADLLPHTMNAEITFDNLPARKMVALLFAAVQKSVSGTAAAAADPTDQEKIRSLTKADVDAILILVPKMLQDAGTSLTVQNSYLYSTALGTSLAGKIDASSTAAFGATGKMALSLKGLDELIKKQDLALKPGGDPSALGYLGGLTLLQAKGLPDKTADGKSLRNYVIELTQDGKILLNGAPLMPLMALPHSTMPAAPASPKP